MSAPLAASPPRAIELRAAVSDSLREFFARKRHVTDSYGAPLDGIWEVAAEQVLGGKLLRPMLFLDTYTALTGEHQPHATPRDAVPHATLIDLATAIELLHFSFLLHDDVIDGDTSRRGVPNLIGTLLHAHGGPPADTGCGRATSASPRPAPALHFAHSAGILVGDLLLSAAHQSIARLELSPDRRVALLDLLEHTIMESVAGELVDVGLSDRVLTPTIESVLTMSARKTAAYTFEFPLRAAAIVAGVTPALERVLTLAGRHLGLAFQLQDDLLSVFGDPRDHGKPPYSDLREGKQTAIISYARSTDAWRHIQPLFGNPQLSDQEGQHMSALLRDCGAKDFTEGLVAQHLALLAPLISGDATAPHAQRIPAPASEVLADLVGALVGRIA